MIRQRRSFLVRLLLRRVTFSTQTKSSVLPSSPPVLNCFVSLNTLLSRRASANSDILLEAFRTIHHEKVQIPLTYYFDALGIFCARKDALRIELLLRLSRTNLESLKLVDVADSVGATSGTEELAVTSRSRPLHDPQQKLVSFAIGTLLSEGSVDEAMTLWVRMSSSGYFTSRVSMEKMLDRIVGNGRPCPPLAFLDKVHEMVVSNRWDKAPRYYSRILCVLRQHLLWSCESESSLKEGVSRLEAIINSSRDMSSFSSSSSAVNSNNLELCALQVQCWVAAAATCRRISKLANGSKLQETFLGNARKAFLELLSSNLEHGDYFRPVASASKSHSGSKLIQEVSSLLEEARGEYDEFSRNTMSFDTKSKRSSTSFAAAAPNFEKSRFLGQVRMAAHGLLTALASNGKSKEVCDDLELFLAKYSLPSIGGRIDSVAAKNGKSQLIDGFSRHIRATTRGANNHDGQQLPAHLHSVQSAMQRNVWSKADADWFQYLIADVLRAANFDNKEEGASNQLASLAARLQVIAATKELALGSSFYAAWIEAVPWDQTCANTAKDPAAHKEAHWRRDLAAALRIFDSLDDRLGRTSETYHAIVLVLCKGNDQEAAIKAVRIVYDMIAENVPILPVTWSVLIKACTRMLPDEELSHTLASLEELILRSADAINNADVLEARLLAHARLCRGYKALQLLRTLRHQVHQEQNKIRIKRRTYTWVINAVYLTWPSEEAEWRVAKTPDNTSEYILREMLRDGLRATQSTVASLLKLYSKASQIAKSQGSPEDVIRRAETFLARCSAGGHLGHPKVRASEKAIRELVKTCCLAGKEEKALEILDKAEEKFGVVPSAECWEPLVYYYTLVKGVMTVGEDVITILVNKKVAISSTIIDAIVQGLLERDENNEALEALIDLHNQHGVRPLPSTLLAIFDRAIAKSDYFEAQRVQGVITNLYSKEERATLSVSFSTTARAEGKRKITQEKNDEIEKDEDEAGMLLKSNEEKLVVIGVLSDERLFRKIAEAKAGRSRANNKILSQTS